MRITALVLSENFKTGVGKSSKAPYEMLTIRVADKSLPKESRCRTILEVTLAKEDNSYRGQLEEQTLEIDVIELKGEFQGCTQASGKIVREAQSIA